MAQSLQAGFARIDITPKEGGIPLAGYGATDKRLAARVLDPLFVNAVALKNGEEAGVFLTLDLININTPLANALRRAASEATGLPVDRVLIGSTHTHSAPDIGSPLPVIKRYCADQLPPQIADAACRALADLKPARLFYGSGPAGREGAWLNFNRYYKMVPIEKKDNWTEEDVHMVGDNFGNRYSSDREHYCYVAHEEEADHSLQIFRFEREAADDIVLANFAAHATITGGLYAPNLSSDYPGAFVQRMEKIVPGIKCSFLQGCAGNVNAGTRIAEEGIRGLTLGKAECRSHYAYADALAAYAFDILQNKMAPSETDALAFRSCVHTAKRDHSMDHLLPLTKDILEKYHKDGYTPEVRQMCYDRGFNSVYHCTGIPGKAAAPATGEIELHAVRIGDCALVTAPFELFSATGLHVKERSPFAMTVVKAYSCGYQSYLPSKDSTPDSYETNKTPYVRGTAEELEDRFIEMLRDMK